MHIDISDELIVDIVVQELKESLMNNCDRDIAVASMTLLKYWLSANDYDMYMRELVNKIPAVMDDQEMSEITQAMDDLANSDKSRDNVVKPDQDDLENAIFAAWSTVDNLKTLSVSRGNDAEVSAISVIADMNFKVLFETFEKFVGRKD